MSRIIKVDTDLCARLLFVYVPPTYFVQDADLRACARHNGFRQPRKNRRYITAYAAALRRAVLPYKIQNAGVKNGVRKWLVMDWEKSYDKEELGASVIDVATYDGRTNEFRMLYDALNVEAKVMERAQATCTGFGSYKMTNYTKTLVLEELRGIPLFAGRHCVWLVLPPYARTLDRFVRMLRELDEREASVQYTVTTVLKERSYLKKTVKEGLTVQIKTYERQVSKAVRHRWVDSELRPNHQACTLRAIHRHGEILDEYDKLVRWCEDWLDCVLPTPKAAVESYGRTIESLRYW